jgi:dipeptidyl aminopeptidase/acylaminoacyl peptidase
MGKIVKKLLLAGAALAANVICQPACARTAEEDARIFGAMESVFDISLAPSGKKIAYVGPTGPGVEGIFVADFGGDSRPKLIFAFNEVDSDLNYCDWATDDRLVCQVSMIRKEPALLLGFTRLFAIGADGSNLMVLTADSNGRAFGYEQHGGDILALDLADDPDKILMSRDWVQTESTSVRLSNSDDGLGVEEVDIKSGKRRTVESPDTENMGFVADENGRLRLKVEQASDASGYLQGTRDYFYREADSNRWRRIGEAEVDSQTYSGMNLVAVDSALDIAYGFGIHDGREAVFSVALDGSGAKTLINSRPDADVDELIRIGRQRRVVGVSAATEKREIEYFDEELAALAGRLQRALPGKPLINIIDASADEGTLLIIASSDTDPGMIYLYEKASRQLSPLLPLRPDLDGQPMAEMKPVSFTASDGTEIPAYLTLPRDSTGTDLPAIVLPHGGPSARDEWGFDWLVQFFAARGYAVLQPNFRGSSGYGERWFGRNGFQAWETAIGDVNDAGRWLVAEGIANQDKLAIAGWSYGGYAALQSQVLDSELFKAVVAIAPVTDLDHLKEENRPYTNSELVDAFVGSGPHVVAGSPSRNVDKFQAPVLLFHGTLDLNVSYEQSKLMEERLQEAGKPAKYIEYAGRAHGLRDTLARTTMLLEIDKFLTENLASD